MGHPKPLPLTPRPATLDPRPCLALTLALTLAFVLALSLALSLTLTQARDEIGRRQRELSTMRAQNVTWSSDNKQRRAQVDAAKEEANELRRTNAAVVAQAATLEERVAKLQDEVTLKSELAAMWRRSAEKGGGGGSGGEGGGGEAEARALTWKLEAEKATREGERWKSVARRAEDALRKREEEGLQLRSSLEESRMRLQHNESLQHHRREDEAPMAEVQAALLAAKDDLHAKSEEAAQLSSKVARLEHAIRQLM